MARGRISRSRTKIVLLGTTSVAGLLTVTGPALAQLSPGLQAYVNQVASTNPGAAAALTAIFNAPNPQYFGPPGGGSYASITVQGTRPQPNAYGGPISGGSDLEFLSIGSKLGGVKVTGNVTVPQGVLVGSTFPILTPGILPPALAAQMVAAAGLPPFYSGQQGLQVVNSTVGGAIVNAGTITGSSFQLHAKFPGVYFNTGDKTGILLRTVTTGGVTNSGLIAATSGYGPNGVGGAEIGQGVPVYGILLQNSVVNGTILNSSTLTASGTPIGPHVIKASTTPAFGIFISNDSTVNGSIINTGALVVQPSGMGGTGIAANGAMSGGVTNTGMLAVSGTKTVVGIRTAAPSFGGGILNAGTIAVQTSGGAAGMLVITSVAGGVTNAGLLRAVATTASGAPSGVFVEGAISNGFRNTGVISVTAGANLGSDIVLTGLISGGLFNSGTLFAASVGGAAFGINVVGGTVSGGITNTGLILAGGPGSIGVGIEVSPGPSISGGITNLGTIISTSGFVGNSGAIDLSQESPGVSNTVNQMGGQIQGVVRLSANADRFVFTGGILNGTIGALSGNAALVSLPSGTATFAPFSSVAGVATIAQSAGNTMVWQIVPLSAPTLAGATISISGGILVQPATLFTATKTVYAKVLNASTTLSDAHSSLSSTSALLSPSLVADGPNAEDLVLTRTPFNAIAGETPNQQAVGSALEGIITQPAGQPFLIALQGFATRAQVLQALSDLSGQNLTQALRTSIETPQNLFDAIETRLITGSAAIPSETRFAQLLGSDQLSDAAAPQGGTGLGISAWAKGYGVFAQAPATSGGSRYHENRHGLLLGGDLAFTENLTLGAAFNYVETTQHFADGAGSNEATSYMFSGYGGYHDGPWYGNWVGGIGINNYNFSRSVGFLNATAAGASSGYSYLGYAEGGYRLGFGAASVSPYAGFGVTHAQFNAFNETGAGIADLAVNSSDTTSVASTLGARASMRLPLGSATLVPEVRGAWQHEFRDSSQRISAAFAIAPGNAPFTVVGSNFGRDSALVGAGVADEVSAMLKLYLDYDGKFTGSYRAHAVTAGLKLTF